MRGRGRVVRVVLRSAGGVDGGPVGDFLLLVGVLERLVGLLGTRRGEPGARPVMLCRCPSVHTVGMAYPLDVALVGAEGLVVGSWRALPPGRVVRAAGARLALERPAGEGSWPAVGERLVVFGCSWRDLSDGSV